MRVRRTFYPRLIYWEVTELCNHNCIHCFNYWRTDDYEVNERTEKSGDFYYCIAQKIVSVRPDKVVLTGGEPLIRFECLKPSIELLLHHNIAVGINTNGALITTEIAEYLSEKGIGLFVSFPSANEREFNGITNTKDGFGNVLKALDIAKECNVRFGINMVVSKKNLNSIYDTARLLKNRYCIRYMSITRVSKPINATKDFDKYLMDKAAYAKYLEECVRIKKELDIHVKAASPIEPCSIQDQAVFELFAYKSSCTAGRTSCVISPSGTVRACVRDAQEYGEILKDKFHIIWKKMHKWRSEELFPKECKKCPEKRRCHGRCRTDEMKKEKNYDK